MYGILHVEVRHYLEKRYGRDVWTATLKRAGLEHRIYMTLSNYRDAEITAIMKASAEVTGVPSETLFEDFGVFVVPALMKTYEPLINPKWSMMDLMLNLEKAVYRPMRTRNPGVQPPKMKIERVGSNRIRLHYDSPRQMPALAKGFIKGIAKHYGEEIDLEEQKNLDGSVELTVTMLLACECSPSITQPST